MKLHDGSLPILRAATDPAAAGGSLWGPAYLFEMRGPAVPGRIPSRAKDVAAAQRLWAESVRLTGVIFDALSVADEPSRP